MWGRSGSGRKWGKGGKGVGEGVIDGMGLGKGGRKGMFISGSRLREEREKEQL